MEENDDPSTTVRRRRGDGEGDDGDDSKVGDNHDGDNSYEGIGDAIVLDANVVDLAIEKEIPSLSPSPENQSLVFQVGCKVAKRQ